MRVTGDPVLPDQGGRMMPVNPGPAVSQPRELLVRRRAYEIYEKRGREPDHALDHWLAAEREITTMQGQPLSYREVLDLVAAETT